MQQFLHVTAPCERVFVFKHHMLGCIAVRPLAVAVQAHAPPAMFSAPPQ